MSFYLAGKLHISDNRGEVWKTVIVLVPLLAAAMISITRIMDGRHHPFDVLSSSILGIFIAWVAYRQYFPSLSEPWKKGRAFPIRSWGSDSSHPAKVPNARTPHDEEQGKAGYIDRGLASSVPEDSGQRRRQYLEDQEVLERKRRRAHDFFDSYTGSNQSQSTTPSGPADLSPQPTAYHPTHSHDPDETFEMSKTTMGRGTQSATDSHESDDYRQSIAAATSAVRGAD